MSDKSPQPLINQIKDAKNVIVAKKIDIDKVVLEADRGRRYLPRMAPPVLQLLTGRESAIIFLVAKLELEQKNLSSPKIIALKGMGGIGKTTLATALAHHPEVEKALSDGTLWVSLGPEPDLMSLLGEWGEQFDEDLNGYNSPAARSRALSSILYNKEILIVIDDVWQTDDAKFFNVGGNRCRVLLTTRNANVARAIAGQDVYQVETLTEEASLELLEKIAPKAVTSDKKDVQQLATQLGGLPLGLIVSGRLLAEQWDAGLGVKNILIELQEKEKRLEMSSESPSLKTILEMSYEWHMEELHKRTFRLLGVFGGKPNTFSLDAAAKICELDLQVMGKVMVSLVNRALVEVVGKERYALHALVADFASTLIDKSEDNQAHLNHAKYFLKIAKQYTADNMKEWHYFDLDWNNVRLGVNWLSANTNLSKLDKSKLGLMADLANALDIVVQARKPIEALRWLQAGENACHVLGRLEDRGWLLLTIGLIELDYGYFDSAIEHFEQCENLFNEFGEARGLIFARGNLGLVHHKRGEYSHAIEIYEQVTKMCESSGDAYGTAVGCYNQAEVYYIIGKISKALMQLNKCISLCRQESIQDLLVKALTLNSKIHLQLGECIKAFACCDEAYLIAEQTSSNILLGIACQTLGEAWEAKGVFETANQYFQKSIQLLSNAKAQEELAEAFISFGKFHKENGTLQQANSNWRNAIRIFEQIGADYRAKKVADEIKYLESM